VDPTDTAALAREWEDRNIPVALKVIDSPFREITKPVMDYVRRAKKDSPRDVVAVFIPEYVVGHWWEQLLHNQSALRLKGRLLFTPGVMVTSVPWQLSSSAALAQRLRTRAERDFSRRVRVPGGPGAGSGVVAGPAVVSAAEGAGARRNGADTGAGVHGGGGGNGAGGVTSGNGAVGSGDGIVGSTAGSRPVVPVRPSRRGSDDE
jgi:hypothetical protein